MNFRIGFGYDVHQLEKGYDLWLGGIKLQHEKGAVGHSDADVLIHAIADALLGAAGLRDIGYFFPDTDPALKGIDSKILLRKVVTCLMKKDTGSGI
jgi:2-C-methyl-D-erythritol 2,4-cyclodiphosphate synthase